MKQLSFPTFKYLLICLCVFIHSPTDAFYLPGVAPRDFEDGDIVELKVNKLTSIKTQLPYDYYSLDFCRPKGGIKIASENLGEFLTGDRIENSPYQLYMREDMYCQILCAKKLDKKSVRQFADSIRKNYHHNWIIDNLPAVGVEGENMDKSNYYIQGFPVGFLVDRVLYINNHVNIQVDYYSITPTQHRVVGFFVEPVSIKHTFSEPFDYSNNNNNYPVVETCTPNSIVQRNQVQEKQALQEGEIIFTYSIHWKPSEVKWASRWDIYLSMDNAVPDKVHWFPIINSLIIAILLSAMVGIILLRNLNQDIARYNTVSTDAENVGENEEAGWKLVHADVFRPPTNKPLLFCVLIGTGVQLFFAALSTIIFATIGFLSPANRGSLMIALLLFFALMGYFAGYYSANLYKTLQGKKWKKLAILAGCLFPGIAFTIFFFLNFVALVEGSTQAVPFTSMLTIICLWFGISLPLELFGAYIGFKNEPIQFCRPYNVIPRPIPEQPWYFNTLFLALIGGILPFSACFVELFFILSSIWMEQYYYVFGFLLLVFFILSITCFEISIVFCYFRLCHENYNWWWSSFFSSGSTGFYVFLYSISYFGRLHTNIFVTYLFYFGYMALISLAVALITGCIGFFSSLWFIQKIYSSIKVD